MKRKTCFSPPVTVELGERTEGAREKRENKSGVGERSRDSTLFVRTLQYT